MRLTYRYAQRLGTSAQNLDSSLSDDIQLMFARYSHSPVQISSQNPTGTSRPPPVSIPSSNNNMSTENKFTLSHLRKLYTQLSDNKIIHESNEELVIEVLYTIAEMVVYGDNKSEILFDFFCEKNMLSLFLEIMWMSQPDQLSTTHEVSTDTSRIAEVKSRTGCPIRVHIQILQTLSILINSVKNNTSLYYLLSNNYINEIIVFPHDFDADESLRDQFVSFMKSLSLRLNPQTVQFFFVEETGAFPLLSRAIDMLHFSEPMVRIAAQTTILNILQVCDDRAREYALQDEILREFLMKVIFICSRYFDLIVKSCTEYASTFDLIESQGITMALQQNTNRCENHLDDTVSSLEDWIYFLQDLFGLKIFKLRQMLIQYLLDHFLYPNLAAVVSLAKRQSFETYRQEKFQSADEKKSALTQKLALLDIDEDKKEDTSSNASLHVETLLLDQSPSEISPSKPLPWIETK